MIHLKSSFNHFPLLEILIAQFNKHIGVDPSKDVASLVKNNLEISGIIREIEPVLLDNELDEIEFQKIDFGKNTDPYKNLALYLEFEKFLYHVRKAIMENAGIVEKPILLQKETRVVSPDPEAYEYTSYNKLDIKETKKGYSFIYE